MCVCGLSGCVQETCIFTLYLIVPLVGHHTCTHTKYQTILLAGRFQMHPAYAILNATLITISNWRVRWGEREFQTLNHFVGILVNSHQSINTVILLLKMTLPQSSKLSESEGKVKRKVYVLRIRGYNICAAGASADGATATIDGTAVALCWRCQWLCV